jgi:signal transduction histidine kinase
VVADMPDAAAVTLDLPADLPALALDRMRIRLLVRNLLDNALRYSEEAGQPPRITLTRQDGGVLLEVRDFGPGVDAEQLARLTEPFYRTDSARQRATGGVGLGMYLCQLVAQAHGTQLEVGNGEPGLWVRVVWGRDLSSRT